MKDHVLFVDDERNFLDGIRRSLYDKRDVWDMSFVDGLDFQDFVNAMSSRKEEREQNA